MEWVMQTGNVPVAMPGKPGCLSGGGGGIVPPALLEERRLPSFYLEAIAQCGASNSSALPNTALVYKLMVTSSLPRGVLSYIWSAVNRSLPGQLTRSEFFSALALIALAQRGESLAALCSMGALPLPTLHAITCNQSSSSERIREESLRRGNTTPSTSSSPSTPAISTPSFTTINQDTFIPTALLACGESGGDNRDLLDLSKDEKKEMWERMLSAAEEIVESVLKLFDQRTNDVIREVCRTAKGNEVITMMGLLMKVMRRVSVADGRDDMKRRVEKWSKRWREIDKYCHKTGMINTPMEGGEKCDLCNDFSASISYGGRFYHGECANLWVNHIDPVLPIHINH